MTFIQQVIKRRSIFLAAAFAVFLVGLPRIVSANHAGCEDWVAKVVSVEGRVESFILHKTDWEPAKLDETLCPDDKVRTMENSRAAILLKNESILRLDQRTIVKFSAIVPEKPSLLELIKGKVLFFSRFPRKLLINTPFVNASSEGTEFLIEVDEESQTTTILVLEGRMTAANEAGSATIESGQAATAKAGERPVVRIVVRPRDAIQWALYYPPVLSLKELGLLEIGELPVSDWRAMVRKSIEYYQAGDVVQAFTALEGAPKEVDDPRFYNYRASLRLAVGRVEEARSDIEKSLSLKSGNGYALALQAIIAVVQNEKDKALELAIKANEAEPNSASVKIALSYAHQANFNLTEALATVQKAVGLDPQNSLAWARLAELWMAEGDLDQALEAAKQAVVLNPRESRAQTVLGFSFLTQIKTSDAKAAFEKAITLAPADPMPRLGMGLAKIREGNLEEGRKDIEIAISLDPNNPLIRSYLGKAYYEEKRDDLAQIQLDMAKELDPNDPTPYLYDAIRKQTINRPVEALHDLQKSIELNDNRAVYRSRLLLDTDQAARSVSLGRIYEDLGFQQLALVEGWKSVNMDPTNYSAHRFLADSYGALQRSEIARLSELLQAQLLQPLNNNPVQPRLGESAPAILAGSGPVDPSFNEFSQLFIRDRHQLLASGVWGENETLGEEIILTGLHKQFSYSVGQFHHETDGFRTNADISQNIYNAFTQVALTPKASVQGEFRYNKTKNGDLDLRFDPDNFSPTQRRERETETYRFGLHYAINSSSDIIGSVYYQEFDAEDPIDSSPVIIPPSPPLDLFADKIESEGVSGEAQYLLRTKRFHLIAGAGHFDEDRTDDITTGILTGFPPPFDVITIPFKLDSDIHHTNFYAYSLLNFPFHATLTLGASGDLLDGLRKNTNQFNPKLGLSWSLTPSTTLRVAGSRVLKRDLVSNQTLEPTQVAGFQQFFDDPNGTDSRRYGAGLDQKLFADLFSGVEISKRDVEIPVLSALTGADTELDVEERLGRAYLFWTPHAWLAASAEYQLERLDSDDITHPFGPKVKTHRVPLGVNLYHPYGFFAKLKATYIDQEGTFFKVSTILIGSKLVKTGTFESGEENNFWTVDASIGYRLPKRLGIWTVEAKNLFDRAFRFQETNLVSPLIQPERLIFTKLTLSF